jgi:hypothetical protein
VDSRSVFELLDRGNQRRCTEHVLASQGKGSKAGLFEKIINEIDDNDLARPKAKGQKQVIEDTLGCRV